MKRIIGLVLVMLVLFSSCGAPEVQEDYGSFTMEKSYSYDEKYYARVTRFNNNDGVYVAVVDIYLTKDDIIRCSISVGEAADFQGFCWEEDSHNVWIQSAEKGVSCYKNDGFYNWTLDEKAVKPDYILTKPQ